MGSGSAETATASWPQSYPQLPATAAGTVEPAAASVQLRKCPPLPPLPPYPQSQDLGTLQPGHRRDTRDPGFPPHIPPPTPNGSRTCHPGDSERAEVLDILLSQGVILSTPAAVRPQCPAGTDSDIWRTGWHLSPGWWKVPALRYTKGGSQGTSRKLVLLCPRCETAGATRKCRRAVLGAQG